MAKLTVTTAVAAAISLLATPILADSVITLHFPDVDPQTILASIITAGPSSTEYFLACPTDADANDCGFAAGITMVEGPNTFEYTDRQNVATINCDVVNSMTASCTESYVYAYTDSGGDGTSTVTSTVFTDWNDWEITVTVTAGDTYAGGPAQSTATTSAGGLGTTTDADPVGQGPTGVSTTRTSLESSAEASQTTAAASTTAASSSQSTAGMPKVTGNAVLAGVAAVFGGVLLMI